MFQTWLCSWAHWYRISSCECKEAPHTYMIYGEKSKEWALRSCKLSAWVMGTQAPCTESFSATPEKPVSSWGGPAEWQGCLGLWALSQGDLGSHCATTGLGDAGFALHSACTPYISWVKPQALCCAYHLLCWHYGGNSWWFSPEIPYKLIDVCCGLLCQQHCEEIQCGLLLVCFKPFRFPRLIKIERQVLYF